MFESLIWLVPAAVLAAGIWKPSAGLVALAASLPLFGAPPGGPYLAALDIAALAAIGTAWRAGRPPPSRLDLPVAVFVAVSLASLVPLTYHPPSWRPQVLADLVRVFPYAQSSTALYTWRAAANLILGWGLYLAVRRAFQGRALRPLGLALGGGLVATLLVGLASHLGLVDLWAYRPIGGPLWDPRLHSLFFHSGWLAEYLILAAPVAVAVLLGAGVRGQAAALALSALTLAGLVLALQRGAWLAALCQLALALVLVWGELVGDRRRLWGLTAAIGVAVLASLLMVSLRPAAVEPLQQRLREGLDLAGREAVWRDSLAMLAERPLLGRGLGGFLPARADRVVWLTPHNQYLMIAAERGLVGLAAFAWLAWVLARALAGAWRRGEPEGRRLAGGLAVAFAGFAVYGLVQYLFFVRVLEWLCWILIAAAAVLAPVRTGRAERGMDRRLARNLAVAILALVAWRWAMTEPLGTPSNRRFGFHLGERSPSREFSWTENRAARRLAWRGEVLVLELANGHPRAAERPVEVTIRLDGRVAKRVVLGDGWEEHRLELGRPARPSVVLGLAVRPVFRPFSDLLRYPELERSRDIRRLGVAVGRLRWEGERRQPAGDARRAP